MIGMVDLKVNVASQVNYQFEVKGLYPAPRSSQTLTFSNLSLCFRFKKYLLN